MQSAPGANGVGGWRYWGIAGALRFGFAPAAAFRVVLRRVRWEICAHLPCVAEVPQCGEIAALNAPGALRRGEAAGKVPAGPAATSVGIRGGA